MKMVLTFGNNDDTSTIRKIKHFSKSIGNRKNLEKYLLRNKMEDLLPILSERMYKRQQWIKDFASISSNNSQLLKRETKAVLKEFILDFILPPLNAAKYRDSYVIPVKVDKKTKKEIYERFNSPVK